MCTITLEYNKNNVLARRKLTKLLETRLFRRINETSSDSDSEQLKEHRKLRNAILENSPKSMSHYIAKYL